MDEDEDVKEILFRMQPEDRRIIRSIKDRFGGTTTAAIRTCIRIAPLVCLNIEKRPLINED